MNRAPPLMNQAFIAYPAFLLALPYNSFTAAAMIRKDLGSARRAWLMAVGRERRPTARSGGKATTP